MSWSNTYVGIPQADKGASERGCDCWGLTRLVYRQELGIKLPSYDGDYVSPDEHSEVAALVDRIEDGGPWRAVAGTVRPFDLLLFRRGRFRSHVGLAVNFPRMLHMDESGQACHVDVSLPRHKTRFCGAYRHRDLERRT
ncbi:C40 family peptidase [Tropicibacter sp. Alg240-R139]|uniref:C40 family peptidase n=1 Tax=Tropicibacter sp. Alg240-R139 TaxID=2305991 RepID=UPI0013E01EDA|nr:NlpC/P60 family protein [Tropicibacter sp. Alg240-R139]